jgi:hypothetical protein
MVYWQWPKLTVGKNFKWPSIVMVFAHLPVLAVGNERSNQIKSNQIKSNRGGKNLQQRVN